MLIGKLHEAWELFRIRVLNNKTVAAKYFPHLTTEGQTALNDLKRHFGKGSSLTGIRNKLAFHYKDQDDLVEENFHRLDDAEPWEFYLSKTVGNSFYYASELIITASMINLVRSEEGASKLRDSRSDASAFEQLCDMSILVSRQITELFGQLMAEIVSDCIPHFEILVEQLPDGPNLSILACLTFSMKMIFGSRKATDALASTM
jgi:hypothetical protein